MQRNAFQQKSNVSTVNAVNKGKLVAKDSSGTVNTGQSKVDGLTVEKPKLASAFNHDFRPRVLVRGSGSGKDDINLSNENVPVSNSFQVLDDQEMAEKESCIVEGMDEEYENEIWPKLKQDVVNIMETGIYPSKEVRLGWSLRQTEYFYNNCHGFGLDPSFEDDDVATEDGGMANDMRPEVDVLEARSSGNNGAEAAKDVPNV